jgi:hypothetical protein
MTKEYAEMSVKLRCLDPHGFEVTVDCGSLEEAKGIIGRLVQKGYRPANATNEWPKSPSGEPICLKHNAVMVRREKQGDVWYSHRVTASDGTERFCRGVAYGPPERDGFVL